MTAAALGSFHRPLGARARVVAHRGHSDGPTSPDRSPRSDGPLENTLAALERAAERGARAVEVDVRVLADGTPVLCHDAALGRLTRGADARAIADLRAAELAGIELVGGGRVPLLVDALAACRARGVAMNLELKHDVPSQAALVRGVAGLLSTWDPTHELLLSSFDPRVLALAAGLVPRLPRALIVHRSGYAAAVLAGVPLLRLAAVHLERTIASAPTVARLKRAGLLVSVWTVDDPGEAADLEAIGVDSLITDDFGALAHHSNA